MKENNGFKKKTQNPMIIDLEEEENQSNFKDQEVIFEERNREKSPQICINLLDDDDEHEEEINKIQNKEEDGSKVIFLD